jgi:S-adenosylmethionine hydrolase
VALVTLTTDFGTTDGYAGAVKGVLAARAPSARTLDLAHDVPPGDVAAAAWLLARAVPFFPPATIHLAVVDPGVGTARRRLLMDAAGRILIGPDNGVFSLVLRALGEPLQAVALDPERLPPPPARSVVFEGRDVFAPAAAEVANAIASAPAASADGSLGGRAGRPGAPDAPAPDLTRWGCPVDDWIRLPWPEPLRDGDGWLGEVVTVDRFGNAVTNLTRAHGGGVLEAAGAVVPRGRAYADAGAGEALALEGSSGLIEIAVNGGSAARVLGLRVGTAVRLAPPTAGPVGRGRAERAITTDRSA